MTDPITRCLLQTMHEMATLAAGRQDLPPWQRDYAACVAELARARLMAMDADPPDLASNRLVPAL